MALDGIYKQLYETQFRQAIDYEENHDINKFPIESLSSDYSVRRIDETDVSSVINLIRGNRKYYRQLGVKHSMRSLTDITSILPKDCPKNNVNLVGFYDKDNKLIAILDFIVSYPNKTTAFIGWFVIDGEKQGLGIGSQIFADIRATMKAQNLDCLELSVQKNNTHAIDFWKNQGFVIINEQTQDDNKTICFMKKKI